MREKTRAGQEGRAVSGEDSPLPRPGVTKLIQVPGGLPPDAMPHPEQVNPSETAQARSARAGLRHFMPPCLLLSRFRTVSVLADPGPADRRIEELCPG
jgi:hypothetical protein